MTREIDWLAQPASPKKLKVIVASCSRSATMGLYEAMKILGFKPYHMVEVIEERHMRVLQEAIVAQSNRFSGIKRYSKPDFDKWMGDFDCAIEIPSYVGLHYFQSYAEDPDIKFILTERDPAKWSRSFDNTCGYVANLARTFPASVLKYFDAALGDFLYLNQICYWAFADGANPGDPNADAAMQRNYIEYIQSVKEVIPKDRLLVVNLEDGLGWEQICPFLELPVPDEKYPRGNTPAEFRDLVHSLFDPKFQAAKARLSMVAMPVLGVISYVGWKVLTRSR